MQNPQSSKDSVDKLFSSELQLDDSEHYKRILHEKNINTISELADMEATDLQMFGIPIEIGSKLIGKARKIANSRKPNEFPYKDVRSWLAANGLEKYADNFNKIPLKMLSFLRRSDLTCELGISLSDVSKIWEALNTIPKTLPPPLDPIDETCELVCTTKSSPFHITINEDNYAKILRHANKQSSSIKVSFIGDTGAGKSLLISQLLRFEDRIVKSRGPLVASAGQLEPTTGNVCFYQTEIQDTSQLTTVNVEHENRNQKRAFILLDFEGAYGGLPRALKKRIHTSKGLSSLKNFVQEGVLSVFNLNKEELTQMTKERETVVKILFPQLAYLISNIVVLIDKNPPHHTGYTEKLKRFSEASTRNPGTGEKPFLIVIQNPVDVALVNEESFDLQQSRQDFEECLKNQNVLEELKQHYRDICFIRLPSWIQHPLLFDQQLDYLQNQLIEYAKIINTDSWYARNVWNDHLWFNYVRNLCLEFKSKPTEESENVNVLKIFSTLAQPETSPFQRILRFWSFVWIPPPPGTQKAHKQQQQQSALEQEWNLCLDVTLERFAGIVIDTIESQLNTTLNLEDMNKENVKGVISKGIEYFLKEIVNKYTPCLYQLKNGMFCGIAAAWHNTGHFKEKIGSHFFPTQYSKSILEKPLKQHIEKLLEMKPNERKQKALDLISCVWERKSPRQEELEQQYWTSCCMICLRDFSKERKVTLLTCGHTICKECCEFQTKMNCPIHTQQSFEAIDFDSKIPSNAGIRILSLDGGNGIRGLIECRILSHIESMTGYKIYQLFDLIVGSGVGGFIALDAALKKDDTKHIVKFLSECTQHRESVLLKRKFLFFFPRYKFQTRPLENQLERLFGDQKLYRSSLDSTTPLVAVIVTKKQTKAPIIFTNYVHSKGLEFSKEIDSQQLIYDCFVWKIATATLSTPPFHRPQRIGKEKYYDGTVVAANPSPHALSEARSLWNSSIDCLISVGSGLNRLIGSNLEGDRLLLWNNEVVDIVSLIDTSTSQASSYCQQNGIYFARLNPELSMGVPLDKFSQKDIQSILNDVGDYLKTNDTQLKTICRHLIASLLYVSKVNELPGENNNWEIIVCSRTKNFSFPQSLAAECQLVVHCVEGEAESSITYVKNDTSIPSSENLTTYATIKIQLYSHSQVKIRINLIFDRNDECLISGGQQILKMSVPRSYSVSIPSPPKLLGSEVARNILSSLPNFNMTESKQSQQGQPLLPKIPPSQTHVKDWNKVRPKVQQQQQQQQRFTPSSMEIGTDRKEKEGLTSLSQSRQLEQSPVRQRNRFDSLQSDILALDQSLKYSSPANSSQPIATSDVLLPPSNPLNISSPEKNNNTDISSTSNDSNKPSGAATTTPTTITTTTTNDDKKHPVSIQEFQGQSLQKTVEGEQSFDTNSEINEISKTNPKELHSPGVTPTSPSIPPRQTLLSSQTTSTKAALSPTDNQGTLTKQSDYDPFKARLTIVFEDFVNVANSLVADLSKPQPSFFGMEEVQKKSFEVRTEREIVKEKEKEEFSQEKDIESSCKQPLTTLEKERETDENIEALTSLEMPENIQIEVPQVRKVQRLSNFRQKSQNSSFSPLSSETETKLSQILQRVLALLKSTQTSERFKAFQVIKTISSNVDYINYFVKNVEFVRSFLGIFEKPVVLVGDNEKLVKEWLTLIFEITKMHNEFYDSFKQHKLVPILIRLLKSGDNPEVRISTCQLLKVYVEDSEGIESVRDAEGIPLLLNMLCSSNNSVQLQAAQVLIRVLEDSINQSIFLDNNGFEIVIQLILSQKTDIRICFLDLLTNFIGNKRIEERFNQLKLQQKYMKLLDSPTLELKYVALKAVGKLMNCGLIKDENEITSLMTKLMDLLNIYIINKNDEMLIHLLDPLTYFTCREEYCCFLRDLGIFGMLLKLVSSSNVVLQKHALALCLLLLNDITNQEVCLRLIGCEMFLNMIINHENPEVRQLAVRTLHKLTIGNIQAMNSLLQIDGVFKILSVFYTSEDENEKMELSDILLSFSKEKEMQIAIRDNGGISVIIETLSQSQNSSLRKNLILILSALTENETCRNFIITENGIPVINKILLSDTNTDLLTAAMKILISFASNVRLLETLRLAGVLDTIYRVLVSCTDERILSLALQLLSLMARNVPSKIDIQKSAREILQNLASHTSSEIRMLAQKILS